MKKRPYPNTPMEQTAIERNFQHFDDVLRELEDSQLKASQTKTKVFGDGFKDGDWRISLDGDNLVFQRRENGNWNDKGVFSPDDFQVSGMSFSTLSNLTSSDMPEKKQLAQVRENSTNAVTIYTASGVTATVKTIKVANTTASIVKVRIFIDNDGTTFDESTAIAWDIEILPNNPWHIETNEIINDGGSMGYRSSVANALTITVSGEEE